MFRLKCSAEYFVTDDTKVSEKLTASYFLALISNELLYCEDLNRFTEVFNGFSNKQDIIKRLIKRIVPYEPIKKVVTIKLFI